MGLMGCNMNNPRFWQVSKIRCVCVFVSLSMKKNVYVYINQRPMIEADIRSQFPITQDFFINKKLSITKKLKYLNYP